MTINGFIGKIFIFSFILIFFVVVFIIISSINISKKNVQRHSAINVKLSSDNLKKKSYKCEYCGSVLKDDENTCPSCGAKRIEKD